VSTTESAVLRGAREILERIQALTTEATPEELKNAFSFIKRVHNGHILVKIDEFKYRGNIIIPEAAKRQPTKGIIIALDPNLEETMGLHVGDRITYSQFAGYLLKFADVPVCRCLGSNEVLLSLENDAPVVTAEGA
jgi:co-chaperonin GroES (HSP10)